MSKSVCALAHREDSTREAFQRYYEENHAPLAITLFPFSAYVRNHVVDAADFGWDTISEFWSDDIARTAALMGGPVGEIMRADEERFMNRARIAPGGAEDVVITPGPRADKAGRRTCLLLKASDEAGNIRATARQWAEDLGRTRTGVCVDFVTSWNTPSFPAEVLIWLPGWTELTDGPGGLQVRTLRVRRCETPASVLLAGP